MKKLVLILCLIAPLTTFAQKQNNQWYFGQNAALDFNPGIPVPVSTSALNTQEGSSSIADPKTGALLFYTDGISVWDKTNNLMPNGTGLSGNASSTQSALIVQQPGSDSLYYIFTVSAQAGFNDIDSSLDYNIVDMTLNGGLGDVTVKNQRLLVPTTEKLSATFACNGKDIWVAGHRWNSDAFYLYLLTGTGISAPVISHAGVVHKDGGLLNNSAAIGNMKFSPDGRKLALGTGNLSNILQVFDFDNATGIVSNPATEFFPTGGSPKIDNQPYGIAFSPDNSKLYVTHPSTINYIYQYDLSAGDTAAIIASRKTIMSSPNEKWYGMQRGPDGIIYIIKEPGGDSLSAITNPNGAGASCNFNDNYIYLGTATGGLNLPNFIEKFSSSYPAAFSYQGCTSQATISFQDTLLSGNLTTHWNFGDITSLALDSSSLQHTTHQFTTGGSYTITLITANSCAADTFTRQITIDSIVGFQVAPPSTSTCAGTGIKLTGSGGTAYTWSPSAGLSATTGASVTANATATTTYTVTATSAGGCTAATTEVFTVKPAPLASFNYALNDKQVSFNSDSSMDATGFSWDFGDSSAINTDANPTHTYSKKDTFYVCLTVYNNSNCSYTYCKNINLLNTGVKEIAPSSSIQLYPNPAGDKLLVNSNWLLGSSIEITNMLGQTLIIQQPSLATKQTTIDISQLSSGVYLLEVRSKDAIEVRRFVKD